MKKSKQIVLLFLYLQSIAESESRRRDLRYTEIAKMLKMPESTIRGVLADFTREGIGVDQATQEFPILRSLSPNLLPYHLVVMIQNPSGKKRRILESGGGIQYRPGVWIIRGAVPKSFAGLSIRLDAHTERELMLSIQKLPVYRRALRERTHFRTQLQRGGSARALIFAFSKMIRSQPLLPEYNFRNELQISTLIQQVTHAVFDK